MEALAEDDDDELVLLAQIGYTRKAPKNGVLFGNEAGNKWTLDISTFRSQHGSIPASSQCPLENEVVHVERVIRNARPSAPRLETRGFELVQTPYPLSSCTGDSRNIEAYYSEVEQVALKLTGASVAVAYAHATRGSKTGGSSMYANYAHTDLAHDSWSNRLPDLLGYGDDDDNDNNWGSMGPPGISREMVKRAMNARRFAIVSAWRYIGPAQTCKHSHLAVLDPATVKYSDAVHFELRTSVGTSGSNYRLLLDEEGGSKFSKHAFYYFPEMDKDNEILLFTLYDTQPGFVFNDMALPTVFHAAFQDPKGCQEPVRESIDVKTLLIFDDD